MLTGSRGRLGLATAVVTILAIAALLSACSLASLFYPPDFSSLDPGMSFPMPGYMTHGSATIRITSGEPRTIQLPHLAAGEESMYEPVFGALITWRGGDWSLRLETIGDDATVGDQGTLTIGREDTDEPMTAEASDCAIHYTSQTVDHFAGTATCKRMVWSTAGFGGWGDPSARTSSDPASPTPAGSAPADLPPFDATITFDATP